MEKGSPAEQREIRLNELIKVAKEQNLTEYLDIENLVLKMYGRLLKGRTIREYARVIQAEVNGN